MAKICMVERDRKRKETIRNKKESYRAWKDKVQSLRARRAQGENISFDEIMGTQFERQKKLPRDASPSRLRRRCTQTGRPRAVYRKFGLSRNQLRELGSKGLIPGLRKASW